MKQYSPIYFSFFRILFGLYLVWVFAQLVPYAWELFSGDALPIYKSRVSVLPNLLDYLDRPTSFVAGLLVLSVAFTLGIWRQPVALLIWYGIFCLTEENQLIREVSIPYIGWLLLAMMLIPGGEPFRLGRRLNPNWSMPPMLFWGAWAVLAVSHFASGVSKIVSADLWREGTLLDYILTVHSARDTWLTRGLLHLPESALTLLTWSVVAAEVLSLPLALYWRTRFAAWAMLASMHFGILLTLDCAQLTLGLLMFLAFTFDPRWLDRQPFEKLSQISGGYFSRWMKSSETLGGLQRN